ncbi:MAG TPA: hypothetical protein VF611_20840, partial [Pyrinomonadaceae bacterium]
MEQRAGAQKNQAEPGRKEKSAAPAHGRAAPELPLLELQQTAGNRAVGRLLRSTLGGRGGGADEQTPDASLLTPHSSHAPQGRVRDKPGGDDPARPAPPPPLAQLKAAPGASAA